MSHFITVVLLPPTTKEHEFEKKIGKLIAPYDENTKVKSYKTKCYCVGSAAELASSEHANKTVGTIDDLRKEFFKTHKVLPWPDENTSKEDKKKYQENERLNERDWVKALKPWEKAKAKYLATHVLRDQPDPKCEECKGKGEHGTTYNPKSKWDWWVIGGRWPDYFNYGNYDPYKDPDNLETCWLCNGTGKRNDKLGQEMRAKDPAYTCNGCSGSGKRLKFKLKPTHVSMPVSIVLNRWRKAAKIPFAMVDPQGRWYEKGKMGWWAVVHNEKRPKEWNGAVKALYEKFPTHIAVAVDCHI